MSKDQKFINLTTHTITETTTGTIIPPSGTIAKVTIATIKQRDHNGIPLYCTKTGNVEGLPGRIKGVVYIVSALTLNEVPYNRTDVVSPGNVVRNLSGQPIGCSGFRLK